MATSQPRPVGVHPQTPPNTHLHVKIKNFLKIEYIPGVGSRLLPTSLPTHPTYRQGKVGFFPGCLIEGWHLLIRARIPHTSAAPQCSSARASTARPFASDPGPGQRVFGRCPWTEQERPSAFPWKQNFADFKNITGMISSLGF